jgi:hypothetical protein
MRDVIKKKYRHLVEEENPYEPTDGRYLSHYQASVSKVLQKMTEDELEEIQNTADSWNSQGVPRAVQLK